MVHQDLCETSYLTVEDAGMYHASMVIDVVAGLQEVLQLKQSSTENPKIIAEPINHVAKTVQSTQQQLATRLFKMQATMQTM